MNDNGTAPRSNAVTLQRPAIVGILFLLNIVFGFSAIIGVILAYIWRGDRDVEEWEVSHYTYLIRTFWISAVVFVVTLMGWFTAFFTTVPQHGGDPGPAFFIVFFGMFAVWLALFVWTCARAILSLVKTGKREPMPNPETWGF